MREIFDILNHTTGHRLVFYAFCAFPGLVLVGVIIVETFNAIGNWFKK